MKSPNPRPLQSPIAVYRFRPFQRRDIFTLIFPGILSVMTPLIYGYQRANYAYTQFGPVAAGNWSRPWYALALFALLVFLFLSLFRLIQVRYFVAVYKKGLHIRFGSTQVLRWEQIAGVAFRASQRHFLGIPFHLRYHAVLYPGSGKPIDLPGGINNLPELVSHIKAHLYPRLLPEMQSSFQAGKWLYFGPIAIQQSAIKLGAGARAAQRSLPWSVVDQLRVQSGYLVVELKNGPRQRLPVSQTPNLEILLDIIQSGVSA